MFPKSAQDPRIIPTLVPELDGFRIFLERIEDICNMVPVAFQSHRFAVFIFAIFAGELERDRKLEQDNHETVSLREHVQEASSLVNIGAGVLRLSTDVGAFRSLGFVPAAWVNS
jgi:hypothetical protein